MPDREPQTSKGKQQEPTAPGTASPPSGDLSPHAPDSGIGEAKQNTSLIPQPPIFDQDLIQALRNNRDAEKLSLTDARLINKFLRENGVDQKEYRKMDAKTKVAAAADKVDLRISSYITDANAYAKKKVKERGFTPIENFDSPFGPGDSYTVESQKTAFRNRLLSGVQDASIQPGTLEAIYLREIRVSVLEKWLNSNHLPDLYTFWAKSPDDIITESSINTRIDDEDKERFLNEQDQPIPLRSMDEYANDIMELEASTPAGEVSGDTATQFTTFAKVIEARKHILGASVGSKDQLVKVDSKLKETFKILAARRLVMTWPDGDVEDLTDKVMIKNGNGKPGNGSKPEPNKPGTVTGLEPSPAPPPEENPDIEKVEKENLWSKAGKTFRKFTSRREKEEKEVVLDSAAEKSAKSKRLKQIMVVGTVLGISVVVASLCLSSSGNDNENTKSGQETPTISAARESVLTAQAKATAKAERSATPTVLGSEPTIAPSSEPTIAPTTTPPENPQNPTPPSQPQSQIRSSEYNHDQATTAVDLADGVKDGFVDVFINVSGTNFDNAQAQTLRASGLNLINKDNLYENGALRWKWTLLASDGNGEKYHWVNVGDQIRIPADKLADAYRWSNVQVPDKIASQVKQVSTEVENKNESVVNNYSKQQQQAATEKTDQSNLGFSDAGENISRSNLNGKIDVKNLAPNVKVHVGDTQEEFQNSVKSVGHIKFINDIVDSPVQSPITKKILQLKYSPTTNFKTKKENEQMRFIAAILYEREREKQLKMLSVKLFSDDDNENEDSSLLVNI